MRGGGLVLIALDPFACLGLERRYDLPREEIERRYLDAARTDHPDRAEGLGERERLASLERASRRNEAYRVLRDPVSRAECLLRLAGCDLESDERRHELSSDRAFLVEMIEARERVEDARDQDDRLEALREEFAAQMDAVFAASVAELTRGEHASAARLLARRRFLQRLVGEIEATQGA